MVWGSRQSAKLNVARADRSQHGEVHLRPAVQLSQQPAPPQAARARRNINRIDETLPLSSVTNLIAGVLGFLVSMSTSCLPVVPLPRTTEPSAPVPSLDDDHRTRFGHAPLTAGPSTEGTDPVTSLPCAPGPKAGQVNLSGLDSRLPATSPANAHTGQLPRSPSPRIARTPQSASWIGSPGRLSDYISPSIAVPAGSH